MQTFQQQTVVCVGEENPCERESYFLWFPNGKRYSSRVGKWEAITDGQFTGGFLSVWSKISAELKIFLKSLEKFFFGGERVCLSSTNGKSYEAVFEVKVFNVFEQLKESSFREVNEKNYKSLKFSFYGSIVKC